MSKKRKPTSTTNNKASITKNTEVYTPDTAPIDFVNNLEDNNEIKPKTIVKKENNTIKTKTKVNTILSETIKPKTTDKYNTEFLTSKAFCKIINIPKYRSITILSMDELIELVLNNRNGKYTVLVSDQCSKTIIDFILNANNSELKCELSSSQKKDRIKIFEAGLKRYKL